MQIQGINPKGQQGNLAVLRADTLAPDVLLVLVEGVLDELTVAEPAQGMHFGYEVDENGSFAELRDLRDDIGAPVDLYLDDFSNQYLRNTTQRVLNVHKAIDDINDKLGDHNQPDGLSEAVLRFKWSTLHCK